MADFYIGRGQLEPVIQARLEDSNDNPINLAGATVKFRMWAMLDGAIVVDDATATILVPDPTNLAAGEPNVAYSWDTGDTITSGVYYGRWLKNPPDGGAYPVPGPITIQVV